MTPPARVAGLALAVLFAGAPAGASGGRELCAAWHCGEPAGSPLAWARPASPDGGPLDISRTGVLCERHAAKAPFVLAGRWVLVFGLIPGLAFGYIAFRVLWVYDRHGPGLARFGETRGREILFGVPAAVLAAWLVFFVVRAW